MNLAFIVLFTLIAFNVLPISFLGSLVYARLELHVCNSLSTLIMIVNIINLLFF